MRKCWRWLEHGVIVTGYIDEAERYSLLGMLWSMFNRVLPRIRLAGTGSDGGRGAGGVE